MTLPQYNNESRYAADKRTYASNKSLYGRNQIVSQSNIGSFCWLGYPHFYGDLVIGKSAEKQLDCLVLFYKAYLLHFYLLTQVYSTGTE